MWKNTWLYADRFIVGGASSVDRWAQLKSTTFGSGAIGVKMPSTI